MAEAAALGTKSLSERPIGIVGLGAIGSSWAVLFAARGHRVRAFDNALANPNQLREKLGRSAELLDHFGLADQASGALSRIDICARLDEAVGDAAYVQECIVEDRNAKARLFEEIADIAPPECVLASSTSELAGSEFFANMKGRERGLVAHPINPPHLVPLVELCPTPWTALWAIEKAKELMTAIGQSPIVLRRELAGFIANRLQMALVGEAMRLVKEGWCTAADADIAVKAGIGLRWAFMGPFETGHLNAAGGAREYYSKYREPIRRLMAAARPDCDYDEADIEAIHQSVESAIPNTSIAEQQSWRDEKLARVRNVLSTASKKAR